MSAAEAKNRMNAIVSHKIEVAPGLIVLRVTPDGWTLPEFTPGQFAVLGLPPEAARCGGSDTEEAVPRPGRLIRRAYSIASSSSSRESVEFYINLVQSGSLTPRLFALNTGDRLWMGSKITGAFTLDEAPPDSNLILVATGTGLAPYMSMLRTMLPTEGTRRIAVILGARHSWDLGYHAELTTMERLCEDFTYLPTISRPDEEVVPWSGRTGYVMDVWQAELVNREWGFEPQPDDTCVFLCGNPEMINTMCGLLGETGYREHTRNEPGEIFIERYW
jgi:ferredoxin--NADP+ reductase